MADVRFGELPLDLAFTDVRGDGSRRLALFGDPRDPNTRALVRDELSRVGDVTVHTLLLPLEIYPGSDDTARRIWAAPDRAAAWYAWMTDETPPPDDPDPHTPLARLRLAAEELQVISTPTLVFESGEMMAGATPAREIEAMLSA
ncbi:putative thiol:disulfide interchange protein DsbC precursor [Actinomadura rubteroloni]|uniref:Putative thiol:disulfide interchange protein DsbC n=1 Tax=Actinomadura rubteroloni TaxID=1926885 RepID=A0A2P4UBC0_9ACTN|nr:DsbC family protein [Actinomadura rubteroloni]POM22332.1 putative thiol:disulfide interchange protein DsbC precursor [Actinomadura rubteroloni]